MLFIVLVVALVLEECGIQTLCHQVAAPGLQFTTPLKSPLSKGGRLLVAG